MRSLESVGGLDLSGDDFEKGLSVEITEGEVFSAASGNDLELSEKIALKGAYIPESKAESDAMEALHGVVDTLTLVFESGELVSLTGVLMVYKEVIAGKLTKIMISMEITKYDADKIIEYSI